MLLGQWSPGTAAPPGSGYPEFFVQAAEEELQLVFLPVQGDTTQALWWPQALPQKPAHSLSSPQLFRSGPHRLRAIKEYGGMEW